MLRLSALILPITVLCFTVWPAAEALADLEIDHLTDDAKGTTVHYKLEGVAAKALRLPLYEVRHLGNLNPPEPGGQTHLLVAAKPCKDCPQDRGIFLVRLDGTKPLQFTYPGKILDPKTRATLMDSRAFYGKCLSGTTSDAYVVFQNERIDRRKSLQSSVYIAEPGKEFVKERLIERRAPRLDATLKRVRTKLCHEVEGRSRLMLTRPLDLTPRRGTPADDDVADDEPKENQTSQELPSSGEPEAAEPEVAPKTP